MTEVKGRTVRDVQLTSLGGEAGKAILFPPETYRAPALLTLDAIHVRLDLEFSGRASSSVRWDLRFLVIKTEKRTILYLSPSLK